jgi:hypothetical protein
MKPEYNVSQLITELRQAAQSVAGANWLKVNVFEPEAFLEPTQAIVFEFHEPDYSLIFFVHFEDRPDQEITIAAAGTFSEIFETLPEKLNVLQDKQVRSLGSGPTCGLRTIIEGANVQLFGNLAEEICRAEIAKFSFSHSPDVEILGVRANLQEVNAGWLVAGLAARSIGSEITLPTPFQSGVSQRKAHAGNIFPLTVIGEERELTFQEKIRNEWTGRPELWRLSRRSWASFSHHVPLVVFAEGMVVADTPHKDQALQAINSFLALCQYFDYACIPMTAYNLGHVTISTAGSPSSWGGPVEIGRRIFGAKKSMPVTDLQQVLRTLERCSDEDLMAQLRLWHAGCTHYLSGESLQAFVLGWTAIENNLRRLWADYLHRCGVAGGRTEKLTSSQGQFTIDHIIEVLNLAGRIDATRYSRLQDLRKIRNKSVHSGNAPPTDDSGRCLRMARELLAERLQPHLPQGCTR